MILHLMIYQRLLIILVRDGYNSKEDAIEDLEEKLTTYKNLSDPAKLYRVVGVNDEGEIDKDKLGEHFTPFLWAIDGDMMRSIGDELWDDKNKGEGAKFIRAYELE